MHDSIIIANRFLELAERHGTSLTPMQVLKLVYIAHGWRLGLYGRPLIQDEVQAWQYGPVIPRLYNAVRSFRSSPIEGRLRTREADRLSRNEENVVEQVFDIYGHLNGLALSRLTHARDTPWDSTYVDGEFGVVIPNDIIEDHYERLAQVSNHPVQA